MRSLLKKENILSRDLLKIKASQLIKILEPGLNYGEVKKDNLKDFFAALVLNKIHALSISMENCVLSNDVFLSVYLYRYMYELYIKVLYILFGPPEEVICRLNEFFENKRWKIEDIVNKTNDQLASPKFKEEHRERYREMSRFVHPNINSLNLHHTGRTDDSQFEFLVPNVNLTIWYIVEIVKLFSSKRMLNLNENINREKLDQLQR